MEEVSRERSDDEDRARVASAEWNEALTWTSRICSGHETVHWLSHPPKGKVPQAGEDQGARRRSRTAPTRALDSPLLVGAISIFDLHRARPVRIPVFPGLEIPILGRLRHEEAGLCGEDHDDEADGGPDEGRELGAEHVRNDDVRDRHRECREERANFQTRSPSANERLLSPKKRVMNATTMSGTSVPAAACKDRHLRSDHREKRLTNRPGPCAGSERFDVLGAGETGVDADEDRSADGAERDGRALNQHARHHRRERRENPSPTSNGTATAAGVPNPAEPSMNAPKSHAITMTCTRRSGVMLVKPFRIVLRAPLSLRVFKQQDGAKNDVQQCPRDDEAR